MSRKSFVLAVGIALLLVGGSSAALFLLIRHEPDSYRRAAIPPGPSRQHQSEEFWSEFTGLINCIQPGSEQTFDLRLTDEQINSFFAEGFRKSGFEERLLPEGITEPRVLFEPGKVRMAFRYGSGLLSTVVSIDFKVWLTREPNVVGLKLLGLQAGSLPIGAQTLLDNLSELVESNGIQIDWYRHEGHPVALLRFQTDQRETTVQLQDVQIHQGSIVIRGKPVESSSGTRAAVLPTSEPIVEN